MLTFQRAANFALVTSILLITDCLAQNRFRRQPTGERKTFNHGEIERAYRIHVPKTYDGSNKVPLVLMLHGGGGDAEIASKMGMTPVADKHTFIVVYPEGINKHWNDGRDSVRFREHDAKYDDVAFIRALVESIQKEFKIDEARIFVTGPSNGGFMTQRLAIEMSDIFSAAGVIIATMGEPLDKTFKPKHPVSILYMNGTEDPLIPYEGGEVTVEFAPRLQRNQPSRGRGISTDDAVQLWLLRNGLTHVKPRVESLPDNDKKDGCTVESKIWTGGEAGTAVALYRVIGGGHTIPGGQQYLPKRLVGNTCGDFDGVETIWQFFDDHGRKPVKMEQKQQ